MTSSKALIDCVDDIPGWPRLRLIGLETFDTGYFCRTTQRTEPWISIQVVLSGSLRLQGGAGTGIVQGGQDVSAGQAFVFRWNHDAYEYHLSPGCLQAECLYVEASGQSLVEMMGSLIQREGVILDVDHHATCLETLQSYVRHQGEAPCVMGAHDSAQLVMALFFALRPLDTAPSREQQIVGQAMHWMRAHMSQGVNVRDVAEACHVGREWLTRCFSDVVQQSPAHWLRDQRCLSAERLLSRGDKVSSVAFDCGFKTASHFIATFKRWSGESPARWQSRLLNESPKGTDDAKVLD